MKDAGPRKAMDNKDEKRAGMSEANSKFHDVPAEVLKSGVRRIDAAELGEEPDIPAEDVLADLRARFS